MKEINNIAKNLRIKKYIIKSILTIFIIIIDLMFLITSIGMFAFRDIIFAIIGILIFNLFIYKIDNAFSLRKNSGNLITNIMFKGLKNNIDNKLLNEYYSEKVLLKHNGVRVKLSKNLGEKLNKIYKDKGKLYYFIAHKKIKLHSGEIYINSKLKKVYTEKNIIIKTKINNNGHTIVFDNPFSNEFFYFWDSVYILEDLECKDKNLCNLLNYIKELKSNPLIKRVYLIGTENKINIHLNFYERKFDNNKYSNSSNFVNDRIKKLDTVFKCHSEIAEII